MTAVVGHEAGHARLLRHVVDTGALLIGRCQRLLHIDGLSGPHGHDGVGGVARRRRGHIDGVHLGIVDKLLGIGVPPWHAVATGVGAGLLLRAAHHRHHLGAGHLGERRAALLLTDLAAAYEAPFQFFHKHKLYVNIITLIGGYLYH